MQVQATNGEIVHVYKSMLNNDELSRWLREVSVWEKWICCIISVCNGLKARKRKLYKKYRQWECEKDMPK